MNENLLNLERSVSKLEQKIATSAMEEKQILDRLWEHYELSHSDAQAQRLELESVPKASRRIGELKRDISALGAPNIGAIEEYERVNTRYTYLTGQRDDVESAKADLEKIIGEITAEMTRIFAQQFKLLSESFQTTFVERHRDQGPAPGEDFKNHLPPLRRREGLCGHRSVLLHFKSPPHPLLCHGRD